MGHAVGIVHELQDARATQQSVGQTDRRFVFGDQHPGRRGDVTQTDRPRSWGIHTEKGGGRVCAGGYGFPYTAAVYLAKALAGNWRHVRAQFALKGIEWRSWSAADQAAVSYLMLQRQYADDKTALRSLYELVEDRDALAELDRTIMGQSQTIVTDR